MAWNGSQVLWMLSVRPEIEDKKCRTIAKHLIYSVQYNLDLEKRLTAFELVLQFMLLVTQYVWNPIKSQVIPKTLFWKLSNVQMLFQFQMEYCEYDEEIIWMHEKREKQGNPFMNFLGISIHVAYEWNPNISSKREIIW